MFQVGFAKARPLGTGDHSPSGQLVLCFRESYLDSMTELKDELFFLLYSQQYGDPADLVV